MAFNCKECGKALIWLKNKETEKPAPIEAEETYYGNIFVKDGLPSSHPGRDPKSPANRQTALSKSFRILPKSGSV